MCQIPNKIIFEILIFLEKKTGEFLNNFLGRKRKNSVLDRKSQTVSFVGYALLLLWVIKGNMSENDRAGMDYTGSIY